LQPSDVFIPLSFIGLFKFTMSGFIITTLHYCTVIALLSSIVCILCYYSGCLRRRFCRPRRYSFVADILLLQVRMPFT